MRDIINSATDFGIFVAKLNFINIHVLGKRTKNGPPASHYDKMLSLWAEVVYLFIFNLSSIDILCPQNTQRVNGKETKEQSGSIHSV